MKFLFEIYNSLNKTSFLITDKNFENKLHMFNNVEKCSISILSTNENNYEYAKYIWKNISVKNLSIKFKNKTVKINNIENFHKFVKLTNIKIIVENFTQEDFNYFKTNKLNTDILYIKPKNLNIDCKNLIKDYIKLSDLFKILAILSKKYNL